MLAALVLAGTVLAQSVPCQRLMLDDGTRVWVQGLPEAAAPGTRVVLDGEWRNLRSCNARVFVISRVLDGPGAVLPGTGDPP